MLCNIKGIRHGGSGYFALSESPHELRVAPLCYRRRDPGFAYPYGHHVDALSPHGKYAEFRGSTLHKLSQSCAGRMFRAVTSRDLFEHPCPYFWKIGLRAIDTFAPPILQIAGGRATPCLGDKRCSRACGSWGRKVGMPKDLIRSTGKAILALA